MSESINVRMVKVPDELTSREIRFLFESVLTDLAALAASHNQLLTDYNAHVHGGVTAGAANTSNVTDSTAVAVTLNTTA
jgi:hypothetical protein